LNFKNNCIQSNNAKPFDSLFHIFYPLFFPSFNFFFFIFFFFIFISFSFFSYEENSHGDKHQTPFQLFSNRCPTTHSLSKQGISYMKKEHKSLHQLTKLNHQKISTVQHNSQSKYYEVKLYGLGLKSKI